MVPSSSYSRVRQLIGVSRVGGIPEVVTDGVNGLLVPPEDPATLAQAIQHLMDDPATAQKCGLQARQRFEQAFSIDTLLAHTLRVYQRTLAARLRTNLCFSRPAGAAPCLRTGR